VLLVFSRPCRLQQGAAHLLILERIPLTLKRSLHGGKSSPPAPPRVASVDALRGDGPVNPIAAKIETGRA
jgi:hypothetical protein